MKKPDGRPLPRPTTIPYVAQWSGERDLTPLVVARGPGIAYRMGEEVPQDRYDGVLWARRSFDQGKGTARLAYTHPQRQRRAMAKLLCQVCAKPASRTKDGVLWLVEDDRGAWPDWPEGLATAHPPLCVPCAGTSLDECHHWLREKAVVVRSRASQVSGVLGAPYQLQGSVLVPQKVRMVRYDDPAIAWTLARQLVRTLYDCTLLDPAVLAA
ncbi:hypothetical protein [Streptomyces megasporus]|uniref:hypothetical protein n=1 Tax=Streptomyces megasporus TaxID=44060 RepID=UPI00056BDF7C|nr:hypothetical protein [Streptomyces megasporus]